MNTSFRGDPDVIKILIRSGAAVPAVNVEGLRAIDYAIKKNNSEVAEILASYKDGA